MSDENSSDSVVTRSSFAISRALTTEQRAYGGSGRAAGVGGCLEPLELGGVGGELCLQGRHLGPDGGRAPGQLLPPAFGLGGAGRPGEAVLGDLLDPLGTGEPSLGAD